MLFREDWGNKQIALESQENTGILDSYHVIGIDVPDRRSKNRLQSTEITKTYNNIIGVNFILFLTSIGYLLPTPVFYLSRLMSTFLFTILRIQLHYKYVTQVFLMQV